MQFEDRNDDEEFFVSPSTHSQIRHKATTPLPTAPDQILKLIVSDVVVDLLSQSRLTTKKGHDVKDAITATDGAFQMLYVDLKWRNKSLRTVASAKKSSSSKTSSSDSSLSSSSLSLSSTSTFSGGRAEISNKGSTLIGDCHDGGGDGGGDDGEKAGRATTDVMVVTLRRCEIFGDSDLFCVAFRLADVPWVRKSPVVVRAGPFMLSLQAETFGFDLPPELTLAERIDAVGGVVDVVIGVGEEARQKMVPFPPSPESLRRKEALVSVVKVPAGRKQNEQFAAKSDPLSDGTAEAAERRNAKNRKIDDLKSREDKEREKERDGQEVVSQKASQKNQVDGEGKEHDDQQHDDSQSQMIPQEISQILEAQVPPEPPVLARMGIDLEISPPQVSGAVGDFSRNPNLLHNTINSAAPAIAAAARHDVQEKLRRDLERELLAENYYCVNNVHNSQPQRQRQHNNFFTVALSSIQTVVTPSSPSPSPPSSSGLSGGNANNINNNSNNDSSTSSNSNQQQQQQQQHSPMTILLNLEVKPSDRGCLLDPELIEKIRRILEREANYQIISKPSTSCSNTSATSSAAGFAPQHSTISTGSGGPPSSSSNNSGNSYNSVWGPSDFPNVAKCIMENVLAQGKEEGLVATATATATTSSAPPPAPDVLFRRAECTTCEVSPPLTKDQLAEQARIMKALESKPLEIIVNHNLADPAVPLRWRGTLPDERCPTPPIVYRRDKYTINALISVNLLPLSASSAALASSSSSSSSRTTAISTSNASSSPAKNFFSAISSRVTGAVERVASSIDSDKLLSDFPELRSQMWTNGQSRENQKICVAAVFDCQALNGFGTPLSGKLYLTANEMFFHAGGAGSSNSNNPSNPASKIHWRATFSSDILCVRRVVAFGAEAFQVFARGGTCCMHFQNFDGFFARAGLAVGLRSFTKFFEAWMIVLDLWHAWRSPVMSEVVK